MYLVSELLLFKNFLLSLIFNFINFSVKYKLSSPIVDNIIETQTVTLNTPDVCPKSDSPNNKNNMSLIIEIFVKKIKKIELFGNNCGT